MSHDLEEFKKRYLAEFGEELSEDDAERKARMLLNLYKAVYRSLVDVVKQETSIEEHHNEQESH